MLCQLLFQINNAGIGSTGDILNETLEQFDSTMAINIRVTKLAIPHLIESKGSIVNVSSIFGIVPVSQTTLYNA